MLTEFIEFSVARGFPSKVKNILTLGENLSGKLEALAWVLIEVLQF